MGKKKILISIHADIHCSIRYIQNERFLDPAGTGLVGVGAEIYVLYVYMCLYKYIYVCMYINIHILYICTYIYLFIYCIHFYIALWHKRSIPKSIYVIFVYMYIQYACIKMYIHMYESYLCIYITYIPFYINT
jgi:hypothetical protein